MPGVNFDAAYSGTPPWDIGRPQPAFLRLAESGAVRGSVLDAGCGTGEHALMAAELGLEATGIDASRTAIELARRKAEGRDLDARFLVWDALDLPALGPRFDTVLDSGLFHVFDDDDRTRYVDGLRDAVSPGGMYLMLCFSDRVPGEFGPRRVSQAEIRSSFEDGWDVRSIEGTTMDVTFTPNGIPAWLSVIART
ncbi:MAG TPA: class I SAM-dependent methyltransferase [Actinomycetota bacterium]